MPELLAGSRQSAGGNAARTSSSAGGVISQPPGIPRHIDDGLVVERVGGGVECKRTEVHGDRRLERNYNAAEHMKVTLNTVLAKREGIPT